MVQSRFFWLGMGGCIEVFQSSFHQNVFYNAGEEYYNAQHKTYWSQPFDIFKIIHLQECDTTKSEIKRCSYVRKQCSFIGKSGSFQGQVIT